MRLLELFAGTRSVSKVWEGWDVVSVDLDPASQATITADMGTWDYTVYPRDHFDFLWASPPCTFYSRARTRFKVPPDLEGADALVRRTLEIAAYFEPGLLGWCFENPGSGKLTGRDVVAGVPFKRVCYCSYNSEDGPLRYRKLTHLWHSPSLEGWETRPICCKAQPCRHVVDGRHPCTAQRAPGLFRGVRDPNDKFSRDALYAIPPDLCRSLCAYAESLAAARA